VSTPPSESGLVGPSAGPGGRQTILITAGPTQEPIDSVRFIGNRSSGRLGLALAAHAARRGWRTHLLLGPGPQQPDVDRIVVRRFRTTAELEALLAEESPTADVVVMAAAVADFRPAAGQTGLLGKLRRGEGMVLQLEPTPDLLAGLASCRRAGQMLVGFALEPREALQASARAKLERKGVDLIVANPLETMDSEEIEAVVIGPGGEELKTPGAMSKDEFAARLLDLIERRMMAQKQEVE
jgi:phosphopantothenoylcysteine decarboxylase / phosphopantothenate---cysteine ligase